MDPNQLPIDIHLAKLLDWILDRRQCPRDWQKGVVPIRNKINLAIQDMPEHDEITSLLSGSAIHYFNCLKIVEILKETEKNSKNIFGMYSSQRMKDWNNIISLYQKNNLYLAETASILQRNVAYEIPALKKQIGKCQQQQTECEEKHASLIKSINEINLQIKNSCNELGIQGVNIASELKALPKQLNEIYDAITEKCKRLEKCLTFYSSYIEYFFNRKGNESLTVLDFVIRNGNATVFQWRTGSEPSQIERPEDVKYVFGDEEELKAANQDQEDSIDFGIPDIVDADELVDQNGEIDWGDLGQTSSEPIDQLGNENNEIDFDIEALKSEICIEEAGVYMPTDGIAKGDDAYTLIEWKETRNILLNDLNRLLSFLRQKYEEMKSDSDNLLISTILQDAPKIVQATTEKDLKQFVDLCTEVLSYFRVKKVEQLFRINDSSSYLKRLYEQFQAKQKSIKRCIRTQEELKQKASSLSDEQKLLEEKLKLIIQKTKELQKHVCADLSKKYNGVRINIMGEINLI